MSVLLGKTGKGRKTLKVSQILSVPNLVVNGCAADFAAQMCGLMIPIVDLMLGPLYPQKVALCNPTLHLNVDLLPLSRRTHSTEAEYLAQTQSLQELTSELC